MLKALVVTLVLSMASPVQFDSVVTYPEEGIRQYWFDTTFGEELYVVQWDGTNIEVW